MGDHEEGKFLVVSFYSPSVENEIKTFVIDHLCTKLQEMREDLPEFLILGGDTNTVKDVLLKTWPFEFLLFQDNLFDLYSYKHAISLGHILFER